MRLINFRQEPCDGLDCAPPIPHSYVEVLSPVSEHVALFENRVLADVISCVENYVINY